MFEDHKIHVEISPPPNAMQLWKEFSVRGMEPCVELMTLGNERSTGHIIYGPMQKSCM
jgi:hypothetical protein